MFMFSTVYCSQSTTILHLLCLFLSLGGVQGGLAPLVDLVAPFALSLGGVQGGLAPLVDLVAPLALSLGGVQGGLASPLSPRY